MSPFPGFERLPEEEVIIEPATGRIRQAGADAAGASLASFKAQCERSLYLFAKYVLKRKRLVYHLHGKLCEELQQIPPRRKWRLLPMGTFKTSLVSQSLPIHMHIQEAETNCYWPGLDGSEMRVLLGCETEKLASSRLRWVMEQWESNTLLRALWPHKCWERVRTQAKKWNEIEIVLPRRVDYPEPSVRAIGVGGAFIGYHFNVLCLDDLVGFEAANSPTVMDTAWEWLRAARTRLSPDEHLGLEFGIGTRWSPRDIYERLQDDPTVDMKVRALVEDGRALFPEAFPLEKVEQLRKEEGIMFYLWRMNSAADPELTDFDVNDLRTFDLIDGTLYFEEDDRDRALADHAVATPTPPTGKPLSARELSDILTGGGKEEYLEFKYRPRVR